MVFDKLKFWEKKDDFSGLSDLGSLENDPMAGNTDPLADGPDPMMHPTPGMSNPSPDNSFPAMDTGSSSPSFTPPQPGGYQSTSPLSQNLQVPDEHHDYPEGRDRDMELVLAKLDSIKSELDSLHQRVRKIEQHSEKPRTVW